MFDFRIVDSGNEHWMQSFIPPLAHHVAGAAFGRLYDDPAAAANEPRVRGVIEVIRSLAYRRLLGELPGYDTTDTGEIRPIN